MESLDHQFSFCNELMGTYGPVLPSAFLLRATFLTSSLSLMPSTRASLVLSTLEVVESCVSFIGLRAAPPLIVAYMGLIQKQPCFASLQEGDKVRWNALMDSIRAVYRGDTHDPTTSFQTQQSLPSPQSSMDPRPGFCDTGPSSLTSPTTGVIYGSGITHSGDMADTGYLQQISKPAGDYESGFLDYAHNMTRLPDDPIDFDAIAEELGGMGAGGVEIDAQFNANLGYEPGVDISEIIRGEFGGM